MDAARFRFPTLFGAWGGAFVCVAFERRVFSRGLMVAEGRMPRSRFASAGRCLCATGRNCLQALKLAFHWKGPLRGGLKEAFCAHFWPPLEGISAQCAWGLPAAQGCLPLEGISAPRTESALLRLPLPSAGSPFCANGEKPLPLRGRGFQWNAFLSGAQLGGQVLFG